MKPEKRADLRKAVKEDSRAIRRLALEGGVNPTGLKWPRFMVIDNEAGEVIACGQLKPHFDGSVELATLVVEKSHRGQGLARRMVEALIEAHPDDLYLMCRRELGVFYEKFGFRGAAVDEMPPFFRRIKRLAGLVENVLNAEMLLVMHRPHDQARGKE